MATCRFAVRWSVSVGLGGTTTRLRCGVSMSYSSMRSTTDAPAAAADPTAGDAAIVADAADAATDDGSTRSSLRADADADA